MLTITNLTYKIGGRTIIENANLNVVDGWKVGVVGLNGAGKSTLFKLIAGDLEADGGDISMTARHRLGMVRQDIPETDTPLIDMVLAADTDMAQAWHDAETETDPNKLADIYQRLADMDAYAAPAKAASLLTGLGFKEHQLREPFSSFSGGWRMRVALAAALFVEPDVLLLDEPTNHLDLEAIMWLEAYLAEYPHTLMIISHDRDLLNKCIDHVIHVDKQQLTLYTGNYDTFERERSARLGLQQKIFEKQQAQRAHMQKFIDRFRASATKATQAQSRIKALERMDLVDAVIADRAVRFSFPNPEKIPSPMLSLTKAGVGYTPGAPILRNITQAVGPGDRIALLGANGNGKSTLIKLIAGKLEAMRGEVFRAGKLRIGYFSQHQTDELDLDKTPYEALFEMMRRKTPDIKESVVRAKLGQFAFSRDLADNRIGSLSGGEKARLLFAFMSLDAPHLLLLDEPTNHLDIDAREALVQALNAYEGAVVIVSHDPTMLERVADRLWLVQGGACTDFKGDLEDYRKFTIDSRREQKREEKKQKSLSAAGPAPVEETKKAAPPNKSRTQDIEKKIARLTQKKESLESQMAQPSFYTDGKNVAGVQRDYDSLVREIEDLETLWLAAHES
ncbi:MAG: ABC-F family ATP-binding cassette domain-containing protein [Rhodospirillales bacterium]|nr:ABC-F family ATP-binding cassette domain-containing protein [Rhodospirillales bacterium]